MKYAILLYFIFLNINIYCKTNDSTSHLTYFIEFQTHISNGNFAPFWFSSNKYGITSISPKSVQLQASLTYNKNISRNWSLDSGINFVTASSKIPKAYIHQCYFDISWKKLNLSCGSKEYYHSMISRNKELSSGILAEGFNARPIPQVRIETKEYILIPHTNEYFSLKGHLSFGRYIDNKWQKEFTGLGRTFTENILYHSKSLMFKIGNTKKLVWDFEFGLIMATQFGGTQYIKQPDGTVEKRIEMPKGLNAYWKAIIPQSGGKNTPESEQVNVEGNMLGSWNFILNYKLKDAKIKIYLEHFFEDQSQMFWEYGRWKDGLLGFEINLKKKYLNTIVYETLNMNDQSGPLLYDGFWGQFPEYQISASDNYYNHSIYGGWQHNGMSIGTPLIISPIYNKDKYIYFHSNRIKTQHLGIKGMLSNELKYRILLTYSQYLGTYEIPLDKKKKQFCSLYEITYTPQKLSGWSASLTLGFDRGNYLGNSIGSLFTLRKAGGF